MAGNIVFCSLVGGKGGTEGHILCIPTEVVGITTLQESDGTDGFFIISCDIYGSHSQTFFYTFHLKKKEE
jgi:hypothetical protein